MSSIDLDYYWDSVQVKVVIEGKAICCFIVVGFLNFHELHRFRLLLGQCSSKGSYRGQGNMLFHCCWVLKLS